MADNAGNTISKVMRIPEIVDEGIRTGDFSGMAGKLSRLFATDPNDLYDKVKEQYPGNKYRGGHMQNAYPGWSASAVQRARQNVARAQMSQVTPSKAEKSYFTEHTETPGLLMKIFGIIGGGIFGLWTLVNLITHLILRMTVFSGFTAAGLATTLIFAILFGIMALVGHFKQKKAKRFNKYREVLGKKLYSSLDLLSQAVGQTNDQTAKELVKMTRDKWFKEGHLDFTNTTFMATDELFEQYQKSLESAREREAQLARENAKVPPEVRQILEKGKGYIQRIEAANDAIEDKEISDKLDRMQKIVTKIFEEVKEKPQVARNLNMFMDYYLPTTEKLMNAYIELDAQPIQGENIQSAKKEIVASLDVVNDAYEKLLDSFFEDQAMDVSTDISVLKTMMRQQGLTPTELEQLRQKQAAEMREAEMRAAEKAEAEKKAEAARLAAEKAAAEKKAAEEAAIPEPVKAPWEKEGMTWPPKDQEFTDGL